MAFDGMMMRHVINELKVEALGSRVYQIYQQKRMYPYLPEDFSVMVMDLSDSLLIVRVDLPVRDMGVPSCFRVYFAWNDETGTLQRCNQAGKNCNGS